MRYRRALMMLALHGLLVPALSAQRPCRTCRIELTPAAELGTSDGEGTIEHSETVARKDARGRYLVIGSYSTTVKVFDSRGRFVRGIGRRGSGPGEFEGIAAIDLRGDTLVAFDWGLSRYSLFGPDDAFLSAGPLPAQPDPGAKALADGAFLLNRTVPTDRARGLPLHRVDREGRVVLSFGAARRALGPDAPDVLARVVTRSVGNRIWVAARHRYEIDLFDATDGTPVTAFRHDVEWWPDVAPSTRATPATTVDQMEPRPVIMDLAEDEKGLLWLLIGVADPEWRNAVAPARGPGQHPRVLDDHRYRDTMLQVIDPVDGAILASVRFRERVTHFVAPRVIGTVTKAADGTPRLTTWNVALLGRPTSGGSR